MKQFRLLGIITLTFCLIIGFSVALSKELDFSKKAVRGTQIRKPSGFDIKKGWEVRLEFYTTSFNKGWHQLFHWGDARNGRDPIYIRLDGNYLQSGIWDNAESNIKVELTSFYLNRWVPVRFCYDDSRKRLGLFVGNRLVKTVKCQTPIVDTEMPITLGSAYGTQLFHGKLRNVSLFNYAAKRSSLSTQTKPRPCSGLVRVKTMSSKKKTSTSWKTSWGSYNKDIKRSKGIQIKVRNLSHRSGDFKVKWYFIAKTENSNKQ